MKRPIIVVASLLLIALTAMAGVVLDGLRDEIHVSDVGVVLGSKIMEDGTPSKRLQARLDKTAELYRQGVFRQVIVSGGTGKEGFSEAQVMATYLIEKQSMPHNAILMDEHGNTTEATALHSAAIMKTRGFTSALVVSQFFHIPRSRYALRRAGVETIHSAHADYFEARDLYSMAREMIALPAYWLGMK